MQKFYSLLLLLSFFVFFQSSHSQPTLSFQSFITGLNSPLELVNAGDGSNRLFIVEQPGTIKVYDPANGGLQTTPFLDVSALVTNEGEEGLLSMAFHPGYETNGYFFIYYNNLAKDIVVARYQVSVAANVADPASGVILLTIAKTHRGHNGGHLQFGQDGHLYFATGDGYENGNDPNNNAQNGLSLLGKMIRINVDNFASPPYYTVPSNNPFVGNPSFDSRIWALGLRNPFRWSFDRQTGDMWIGDVGQGAKEEVNFTPASSTGGENYGWRCYEGTIPTPNVTPCTPPNYHPPIFDYDNPVGSASSSVIGGYVYRGTEFPFLNGYYLTHDLYNGIVYLIKPDGMGGWNISSQQKLQYYYAVSYGEGEDGSLYVVSIFNNEIYKVGATSSTLPVRLSNFTGHRVNNTNQLKWTTAAEENLEKFRLEYSLDGSRFSLAAEVASSGNALGRTYAYSHNINNGNAWYYRVGAVERNGNIIFSNVIKINERSQPIRVYPTTISDGKLNISSVGALEKLQLFNNVGALVFEKSLRSFTGQGSMALPSLAKGVYIVKIFGDIDHTEKIIIE